MLDNYLKSKQMADLLYSWARLEKNILDGEIGYFHGKDMNLNELKQNRSPDFIWLVRLEDHRLWLLGKLKVTSIRPTNFPKDHLPQFIFYNPSESFFFRDSEAVREVVQATLDDACKTMRKGTMQGKSSVDILDPSVQKKLELLTGDSALIPFNDFRQELLARSISSPPYRSKRLRSVRSPAKDESTLTIEATAESVSDNSFATTELPLTVEDQSAQHLDDNERVGTGYESDPKIRKAIEQHAVKMARSFYEKHEYSVTEKGKPFDLLCEKSGELIHVEVKGSRSALDAIIVTTNEVKDARNADWRSDLFLVDRIVLESDEEVGYKASGGQTRLTRNWVPEDKDLTPMQYQYKLPPIPVAE